MKETDEGKGCKKMTEEKMGMLLRNWILTHFDSEQLVLYFSCTIQQIYVYFIQV